MRRITRGTTPCRPRLRHCALAAVGTAMSLPFRRVATSSWTCSPAVRARAIRWASCSMRPGFDAASMQAFAAWANLSETIFLLPPTTPAADYRVRIFTPRQELPFAGHPSVGAAWAALESGLATARHGTLVQECAAGLLPVRIEDGVDARLVHVRAPRAREVATVAAHTPLLGGALAGLALGRQGPALWNNGPSWWLVELVDGSAVRAMEPDLAAIASLTRAGDAVGLAVYGRTNAADHQLVVRAYCPADNIPEDPVTGSANACIAAQLAKAGVLPGAMGATSQARVANSAATAWCTSKSIPTAKRGSAARCNA